MTDDMQNKLNEWSKFNKKYYEYGSMKSDLDKVITKLNECAEGVSAAKDKYI